MSDVNEYLDLVTSAFRTKPKFTAMITADISTQLQVQDLLSAMIPLFDVDVAVGSQLDIIGKWVGVTRNVAIPISGVFFSWDGTDYSVGWDYGIWQDPAQPTEITSLPDDVYRTLIKTKIAANSWDGTTDGAYAIWDSIFTDSTILIQDDQNMSYSLAVVGGIVNSLTLALLTGGYLPLKPEGVRISAYYTSTDTNETFGWDVESSVLAGWDEGSWLREFTPT